MFASYLSLHINEQKASGSESPVANSRGSEEVVEFLELVWGQLQLPAQADWERAFGDEEGGLLVVGRNMVRGGW